MLRRITKGTVARSLAVSSLLLAILTLVLFVNVSVSGIAHAQSRAGEGSVLQPGANWIGWLGEARSVRDLFDSVPELEAVWAWDASWQTWASAHRSGPVPESPLEMVRPGMGIFLRIGGAHPVRWPFAHQTPVTGLVELHEGHNLVAWSGPDNSPISKVTLGIGRSLNKLQVWDPTLQRFRPHTPSNPLIDRGGVLWVIVDHDVNWLQPTRVWPRVVFAGTVPWYILPRIYRGLNDAVKFFEEEWGIQADHSTTTVYVATDPDSLEPYLPDDYPCGPVGDAWSEAAAWLCGSPDGFSYIVTKVDRWRSNRGNGGAKGRYDLVHEYSHAVQHQLSGGGSSDLNTEHPEWLREGMAFWVEGLLYVDDLYAIGEENRDRDWLRRDNQRRLEDPEYNTKAPALADLEERGAHAGSRGEYRSWGYELSSIAVDRLAGSAVGGRHDNQASVIEYWRLSLERSVRVDLSDETDVPPWHVAFERAFDVTVPEFYDEFRAWRASLLD